MKKIRMILLITLIALTLICLCACDDGNKDEPTTGTYTIQYVDDNGTHTITVATGELYSLDSIPSKKGHEFLGLFDADQGGTQYVHANGSALSAFTDNKNLVLFPQFKANEYTLVLDYGEAAVTGNRQIKVSYGQTIAELPTNLTVQNKKFAGWFTKADKKGTQIADQYGLLPQNSVLTEDVFDLSDTRGFVYLYAGFTGEMHTVRFYFGNNPTPEEVEVEHGTYISKVITNTRVDGKAAISWTKTDGGEDVFTGKVEETMVLYACEYAPVIEFNSNGGNKINALIAKAGSSIELPTPTKENYKFAGWYTAGGSKYTATVMSSDSVSLTARWNPIIMFNTNGGTSVEDISAEVGGRITLPTTSKDGFMFAGWYTEQGQEYTSTSMPQNSVKLVAKYRKIESKKVVLITETKVFQNNEKAPTMNSNLVLDLTDLYDSGIREINVEIQYQSACYYGSSDYPQYTRMKWYYENSASDAYCVWEYSEPQTTSYSYTYTTHNRSKSFILKSNKLWICLYGSYSHNAWKNFWVQIEYPDMSRLY